jgi:SAM-dependent methyltransferase
MSLKLNLGCGAERLEGFVNVDFYHTSADLKVDLYSYPWPWADNSVDQVATFHFLEHVPDLERTLLEIHRILKPGGLFWVKVPHARGWTAYCIGHKHFFTWFTFKTLSSDLWYQWPQPRLFDEISYRVRYLKGPVKWTPLDWPASRCPRWFEQFFPIYPIEIEWKARAVKN